MAKLNKISLEIKDLEENERQRMGVYLEGLLEGIGAKFEGQGVADLFGAQVQKCEKLLEIELREEVKV